MQEIMTVQQQINTICYIKGEHEVIQAIINLLNTKSKNYSKSAKLAEELLDEILEVKNRELKNQFYCQNEEDGSLSTAPLDLQNNLEHHHDH